ncbi:MAG: metallophosphoesterase, partial [Bacteroidales bacterium]|nr:metallophosphoesterase [Bacteroidales bacterium]
MKRFNLLLTLLIALTISACAPKRAAVIASDIKDIVILYDNDVHCAVDGYPAIAALKKQLKAENNYVTTVSSGDFVQGGSLGAVSKGEYIVRLLNAADYDFVALGNHEFDYGLQRLDELSKMLSAQILCCNLSSLKSGRMLYPAYSIVDYGGRKVGFIGVSTPYSFASSTPAHFKDSDGNWLYSLHSDMTYEIVQQNIDEVRAKGADYVVLLTHLGIDAETDPINSLELIKHVSGMDVVLDGHSHVTISSQKLKDKNGKEVVLTSTGSHFENIGKLQIKADGTIS